MRYAVIDSPLGSLTLASSDKGLAAVRFGDAAPHGCTLDSDANAEPIRQINEYFLGQRTCFDLSIDPVGTSFQLAVWRELLAIPYGETRSYGDIAKQLNKPGASRAVGMANHHNPVAIVIPCHRVIGQNGSLTGYAGGVDLKQKLLSIEQRSRTLFT
jgi:methylated-DNA-[protein]-cysteine S-methyltransferase